MRKEKVQGGAAQRVHSNGRRWHSKDKRPGKHAKCPFLRAKLKATQPPGCGEGRCGEEWCGERRCREGRCGAGQHDERPWHEGQAATTVYMHASFSVWR